SLLARITAELPIPGGLRLRADDSQLLAKHRVHQRRLADVRLADHRDEPRPVPLGKLLRELLGHFEVALREVLLQQPLVLRDDFFKLLLVEHVFLTGALEVVTVRRLVHAPSLSVHTYTCSRNGLKSVSTSK